MNYQNLTVDDNRKCIETDILHFKQGENVLKPSQPFQCAYDDN
jgi:hypothetical protein